MLQRLGGIIGLAAGLPLLERSLARAQGLSAVASAPVSLTSAEAETLRAIIARIIPADENGPGALEARADRYIDRALAGALKNQRSTYTAGLAAIDAYAQSAKGSAFAKLSTSDQDLILTEIQSDRVTGFAAGGSGAFSDPFYGGNENFIGWDLIGYPGARVVVSPNLQRLDIKPESSKKSAYDYSMFNKGEV